MWCWISYRPDWRGRRLLLVCLQYCSGMLTVKQRLIVYGLVVFAKMASAATEPKPFPKGREKERGGERRPSLRQLLEWLVTAQLRSGEFLSELALAARCNTSRTPVREARSRFAQDRWLSLIRRKGWMVTPLSIRDISEMYECRKPGVPIGHS